MDEQVDHEYAIIAYYCVHQADHPRNSGIGVEHFTVARNRAIWSKALASDAATPWELGLSGDEIADLSGSEYGWASHIPPTIAALRRSWSVRKLRSACNGAVSALNDGADLDSTCGALETAISEARAGGVSRAMTLRESNIRTAEDWLERARMKDGFTLPIFLPELHGLVGGWVPGKLHLIVARSSEHKTTFARQSAEHIADCGHGVIYWTAEDSHMDISARDIASKSDEITTRDIISGTLPPKMASAKAIQDENPDYSSPYTLERMAESLRKINTRPATANMLIIDTGCPRLSQIASEVGQHMQTHKIRALFFDFAQLIRPDHGPEDATHWKNVSAHLANMAKTLGIAIVACCQIDKQATRDSKDSEDRHPRISDVYGGISWMQNAFAGIVLWKNGKELHINVEKWKSAATGKLNKVTVDAAHDRIEFGVE